MTIAEKVTLTKEKETLLITLYAKAGESRLPDSLLHDSFAAEAVCRIDYDFSKLQVRRDDMIGIAMRAHILDEWTRAFIAGYPNATVLHLGCGLDSRVFRLDPPAGIRWFDVDYPEVIALRRRLYPERAGYTMIGSSVTEPGWLDAVPGDAPTMIVAEGLVMYLSEAEVHRLFQAVTAHVPSGELAFDAFSRLGAWFVERNRMVRATGASLRWGIDDPHDLEIRVPKLKFVAERTVYDPAEVAKFARFSWPSRLAIRLMAAVPALRRLGRLLRYRF